MQHSSPFPNDDTCRVYFSCPKFTVLLVTKGSIITKAAPIAKRFEGQTIEALKKWANTKFGGPIVVRSLGNENGQLSCNAETHSSPCCSSRCT